MREKVASSGVPVLTPEHIRDPAAAEAIAAWRPEVMVVAAYGQFLRRNVLDLAPRGVINIHPSLLPKYRGAAPIQWALARGDPTTGVTILYVTERMDAGDMILQEPAAILPEDTAGTLEPRLAEQGASMLIRALDRMAEGPPPVVSQDESLVVLAPKLSKCDGWIRWNMPAREIHNRIRGFTPWPGCCTRYPHLRPFLLKVLSSSVVSGAGVPGTVLSADDQGIVVAAGAEALRLVCVQPEGKRGMSAGEFVRGYRVQPGLRLEEGMA